MTTIYLTGSRQFFVELESIKEYLQEQGFSIVTSEKGEHAFEPAQEQEALRKAFERIPHVDAVYVYTKKGYVGKTVLSEMSFAFAKSKPIISSDGLNEPLAQMMLSHILRPEELLKHFTENCVS